MCYLKVNTTNKHINKYFSLTYKNYVRIKIKIIYIRHKYLDIQILNIQRNLELVLITLKIALANLHEIIQKSEANYK